MHNCAVGAEGVLFGSKVVASERGFVGGQGAPVKKLPPYSLVVTAAKGSSCRRIVYIMVWQRLWCCVDKVREVDQWGNA
jgi:hypothetical protein